MNQELNTTKYLFVFTICFTLSLIGVYSFHGFKTEPKKKSFEKKASSDFQGDSAVDYYFSLPDGYLDITPSSKKLFLSESLTIKMNIPHARKLGVIDPDGRWAYLSNENWTKSDDYSEPFIDSREFQKRTALELDTTTIQADFGSDEVKRHRVFSKTGWYTFRIGDEFEMCDPLTGDCFFELTTNLPSLY